MLGLSFPISGVIRWENIWHILTIVLLAIVVWFSAAALEDFNTKVETGDASLSTEIGESAGRQAAYTAEVGEDLAKEIKALRDRQSEDRASSSALTTKVEELNTRTSILEDREARRDN